MAHRKIRVGSWAKATAFIIMATMATLGGCDCGNDNRAAAPTIPLGTTPGSGLFVIECNILKAFVPLLQSPDPGTGFGRVAVIDLSKDPDAEDPREATIVLGHYGNPTGAAFDSDSNLVIVVSTDSGSGTGFVDLIDPDSDTLTDDSPIEFPAGHAPGSFGQVLYDPIGQKAIMNVLPIGPCVSGCTGFVTFDVPTRTFSSVLPANYAETFAFDPNTNTVLDASDSDSSGEIGVVDFDGERNCVLADANIGNDNDGASVDPSTTIAVVSNEDGTATVINLNGSTISDLATGATSVAPTCEVTEGGTPPNSVLLTGLPSETAGSAVNPETHEAFLIEDGDNGVTLVTLPSSKVTQISAGMVDSTVAFIPDTPDDSSFDAQGDPYAVAYDVCNNIGYTVDDSSNWLVGVDIASMKADPGAINDDLLAGQCAGTTSDFSCKNGSGVTYFPLPPVGVVAGAASP